MLGKFHLKRNRQQIFLNLVHLRPLARNLSISMYCLTCILLAVYNLVKEHRYFNLHPKTKSKTTCRYGQVLSAIRKKRFTSLNFIEWIKQMKLKTIIFLGDSEKG